MSNWRVGHQGRDNMYYEEQVGGSWQRIEVQGEMLMGPAHHVIYFASPAAWEKYPEWARGRRDEIISRIKSEFSPPDYEYNSGGGVAAATPTASPRPGGPIQGMRALGIAILLMGALGGGMLWLAGSGLSSGVTTLPHKWATVRRPVIRAEEPVMYWTSITIYAAIGIGALGLGAWGIRERRRVLEGRS